MGQEHELTPEQYHAALNKLWTMLGNPEMTDKDVFDRVVDRVEKLTAELKTADKETKCWREWFSELKILYPEIKKSGKR